MEQEQERPQMNAELAAQGAQLAHEFGEGFPMWRDHPRLAEAAAKVAKAAQEQGDELNLFDERVGQMNRAEFYSNVAAELASKHSLSGDLKRLQGRK